MNNSKRLLALAVSAALAAPMAAYATNGMNLEGYGPIAAGMGGASMAYDNGTAAMMNNPATLGMQDEGSRLDVAIGVLGPDVTTDLQTPMGVMSFDSTATSFLMPAVGWTKKSGKNTYGVGIFAQGGMGATYDDNNMNPGGTMSAGWMTNSSPNYNPAVLSSYSPCDVISFVNGTTCDGNDTSGQVAAVLGASAQEAMALEDMSEVGVGRLLFPFAREVNDQLTVAGSIDYVWAGMDLKMAMPGMMMGDMMMNPNSTFGSISGTVAQTFGGMMASAPGDNGIYGLNYGYLDFADDSPYTGEAKGTGFAGKLGVTFKANDKLTIGATYHSKTSLSKLKAAGANVSMNVLMTMDNGANFAAMPLALVGDMEVDFQWPSTMALGVAFQANDKLMLVADVKKINWSEVMTDFNMSFTVDNSASNDFSQGGTQPMPNMQGQVMDMTLYQNWEDQTVIQIGAAYQVTDAATVRVGYNSSSNPIPDENLNWLFPAVSETAITLGAGFVVNDSSSVDVSLNSVSKTTGGGDNGFETSMTQLNYQLMYSKKF